MARRVFFSFHYERDVQRASVIRNSWVTKPNAEEAGFIDAVNWEEVKKKGEASIKAWIDRQLDGTSVTVVLIGAETSSREWVRYEVRRSHEKENGMFGIFMHNIKDWSGQTHIPGNNQFGELGQNESGEAVYFWQIYPTYDWVNQSGYLNLGNWVEQAAKLAGK